MKKTWIKVKRGLLEPKHIVKLGEAWYLYLYILDNADWETGTIPEWKDKYAADELGKPLGMIREHRKKLIDEKYISTKLNRRSQIITINNWTDPRKYDGEVINKVVGSDLSVLKTDEKDVGSCKGNGKGSGKGFSNPSEKNTLPYNHISHDTYHKRTAEEEKQTQDIIDYFMLKTKLKPLNSNKFSFRWIAPLKEMMLITDNNLDRTKNILLQAIKDCDKSGWTFDSPLGIMSKFRAAAGKQKRGTTATEFDPRSV